MLPPRATLPRQSASSKLPSSITSPQRKNCSIWLCVSLFCTSVVQFKMSRPACRAVRRSNVLAAHLAAFDESYPHMFVYVQELPNLIDTLQDKIRESPSRYQHLWEEILQQGVTAGELRADLDVQATVLMIMGMCNWLHLFFFFFFDEEVFWRMVVIVVYSFSYICLATRSRASRISLRMVAYWAFRSSRGTTGE